MDPAHAGGDVSAVTAAAWTFLGTNPERAPAAVWRPLALQLARDAMAVWAPCRHALYHRGFQRAVGTVVLVAQRQVCRARQAAAAVSIERVETYAAALQLVKDTGGDCDVATTAPAVKAVLVLPAELWLLVASFLLRRDFPVPPRG